MKKMIFFMALAMTLTAAQAQIRIGGKSINLDKATQAVSKVAKAVTLSDADLSGGAKQSAVQKMFSSHPDDGKRVARAKALAEKYSKTQSKKK